VIYKKYQHLERFGKSDVAGIEKGTCYVFHKLDGTNGQVWFEDGKIQAGSRNRQLTIDSDNAGFYNAMLTDTRMIKFFKDYPYVKLFGEWLVPHTIKTYEGTAWREFYVFDMCIDKGDDFVYLPYEEYTERLEKYGIKYIPMIAKIDNPTYEQLTDLLPKATYLVQDGKGTGEGIVIKNYNYVNSYGRVVWAKIVGTEFFIEKKTNSDFKHAVYTVEEQIVNDYITQHFVDKTYSKIVSAEGDWSKKLIPQLINRVFYDLITEETWNFIKENKMPNVDFRRLQNMVTSKIKELRADLF
jgi:RNA ligase